MEIWEIPDDLKCEIDDDILFIVLFFTGLIYITSLHIYRFSQNSPGDYWSWDFKSTGFLQIRY